MSDSLTNDADIEDEGEDESISTTHKKSKKEATPDRESLHIDDMDTPNAMTNSTYHFYFAVFIVILSVTVTLLTTGNTQEHSYS